MKLIISIAIILCISSKMNMQRNVADLSLSAQKICHEILPTDSSEKGSLASLVCGQKVTDQKNLRTLQATGLIHIFVVSGGHLVVLSELFIALRWQWWVRFIGLLGFTLFTGFQVPCLRSLTQFSLTEYFLRTSQYMRSDQRVFFSGFFLLLVFPDFAASLSLQLSWGAALVLALNQQVMRTSSRLKKFCTGSLLVYLIMYPLLSPLMGLNPLSILWNIIIGPLMTFLLFPLAGISVFNSAVLSLFENMMPWLWWILGQAEQITTPFSSLPWNTVYGWIWIFSWHAASHFFLIYFHRKYST